MNPNTPGMPADANTYSVNNGILSMGVKNTPSDVPGSLVNNQPFLMQALPPNCRTTTAPTPRPA